MSKFSTDELVEFIKWIRTDITDSNTSAFDAIIARLRAADNLCEAARKSVDNCPCNFGGLDEEGRPFGKQPCDECDPLRKAIADYEEKEKK